MIKIGFLNEKKLPVVVEPDENADSAANYESLLKICEAQTRFLREQLLAHAAILLRGFGVENVERFAQFVRAFSRREPLDYVGGVSPRVKLGGGVYTSTEYPNFFTLSLHNELSYTAKTPELLYFCCLTPAETGGETPLADSRALLKSIDAAVVERFKTKKIRYDRNLSGNPNEQTSWQAAFETADKTTVENWCREIGARFEWKLDGGLRLSEVRPAIAVHPATGEEVWFNQADGFHTSGMHPDTYNELIKIMPESEFRLNCCYGDGSMIETRALDHVRETMRKEMALFKWQAGDVLVLDNKLACHGRMPFTGARKVVLAMT